MRRRTLARASLGFASNHMRRPIHTKALAATACRYLAEIVQESSQSTLPDVGSPACHRLAFAELGVLSDVGISVNRYFRFHRSDRAFAYACFRLQ